MDATDWPRTWNFDTESVLVGRFIELRRAETQDGPRALVELELEDIGLPGAGERVTVWLSSAVLRRRFADELRRRARSGASDFEPGELVTIERGAEKRVGASGFSYWPFSVRFEHAAKESAAEILLGDEAQGGADSGGDAVADDSPF
jgi:hypothetical protein